MTPWVKDLALSLLWYRFDPWTGSNMHALGMAEKKKKRKRIPSFLFHRHSWSYKSLSTDNYLLAATRPKTSPSGLLSFVEFIIDSVGATCGKEAIVGSGFLQLALWWLINRVILTFSSSTFFTGNNIS